MRDRHDLTLEESALLFCCRIATIAALLFLALLPETRAAGAVKPKHAPVATRRSTSPKRTPAARGIAPARTRTAPARHAAGQRSAGPARTTRRGGRLPLPAQHGPAHPYSSYSAPLTPRTPLPLGRAPQDAGSSRPAKPEPLGTTAAPLVPGQATKQTPAATGEADSSLPASSAEDLAGAQENAVDLSGGSSIQRLLARSNSALQFPGALRGFFGALRRREDEPDNGAVRIMQWGDSHTAADMFTGEARARMQGRFGDGGVGFTYAGHPFAGYRILGSGRGESGSWTTLGTHFTQLGDALLGLGGVAIESERTGDSASLDAPCLTLEVQYLRQPGGGSFTLSDNGFAVQTVSTASALTFSGTSTLPATAPSNTDPGMDSGTAPEDDRTTARLNAQGPGLPGSAETSEPAGLFHYACAAGSHHFSFTAGGGGPVRLLGTTTLQPGVTWESMGINGAEAPLMLRWNQPLFQSYLREAAPALIVLAYGTNEAAASWTAEGYRAAFTRLIDMLHANAPASSILVLGPGDRALGHTTYTIKGRGRRARRIPHRFYTTFSGTDRILNAQREVCRTHGCAFWDWRERQGGPGAMMRWVAAGYAQPDHTHLTGAGYRALADALIADLLSAYSGYGQ